MNAALRRHCFQHVAAVQPSVWLRGKSTDAQRRAYEYYAQRNNTLWNRLFGRKRKQLSRDEKNTQLAWYAVAVVIGSLGATYAAVPLYKVFCQTTGFGGTTQRIGSERSWWDDLLEEWLPQQVVSGGGGARVHTWTDEEAAARLATLRPVEGAQLVTVYFDATVGDVLPWTMEPLQRNLQVVPGETALAFFRVTNHGRVPITGVATYNVHPPKMGLYFQKIQCFCFEEQRLLPGETVDMPVFFFIDPEVVDDAQVSYVRSVTLSYTFFPTEWEEGEEDLVATQK